MMRLTTGFFVAVLGLAAICLSATSAAQTRELIGVPESLCFQSYVLRIRMIGKLGGIVIVDVATDPAVARAEKDRSGNDALVKFCSDDGTCKSAETKVYFEKVTKTSYFGHFAVKFADGKSLEVHFRTVPPPGKAVRVSCE